MLWLNYLDNINSLFVLLKHLIQIKISLTTNKNTSEETNSATRKQMNTTSRFYSITYQEREQKQPHWERQEFPWFMFLLLNSVRGNCADSVGESIFTSLHTSVPTLEASICKWQFIVLQKNCLFCWLGCTVIDLDLCEWLNIMFDSFNLDTPPLDIYSCRCRESLFIE